MPAPCFFFEGPIRAAGGARSTSTAAAADGWRWDAERARARDRPADDARSLLCNPGNPTGHVPSPRGGRRRRRGRGAARPRSSSPTRPTRQRSGRTRRSPRPSASREDVVVIRSLGKSLSLPQLRLGIARRPARAASTACARTLEWDCLRVGVAAQEAALAALDGPADWLDAVHAGLVADRAVALAAVAATPGLCGRRPRAAPVPLRRRRLGDEPSPPTLAGAGLPGRRRRPLPGAGLRPAPVRRRRRRPRTALAAGARPLGRRVQRAVSAATTHPAADAGADQREQPLGRRAGPVQFVLPWMLLARGSSPAGGGARDGVRLRPAARSPPSRPARGRTTPIRCG